MVFTPIAAASPQLLYKDAHDSVTETNTIVLFQLIVPRFVADFKAAQTDASHPLEMVGSGDTPSPVPNV